MNTDTDPRVAEAMWCLPPNLPTHAGRLEPEPGHRFGAIYYTPQQMREYAAQAVVAALDAKVPSAPVGRICTHPPGCTLCAWCGFRATTPPTGKTENEIDRLETEVARLNAELQEVRKGAWPLSYHDVEFQVGDGYRQKLSEAPFELMITCTRVGAWELFGKNIGLNERELLAGEYCSTPLRLYVAGRQIVGAAPEAPKP